MKESPPPARIEGPALPTLRSRVVRGSAWWAGTYPLTKIIQIVSNVVLAGLLSPTAFGVVALGQIAVSGIRVISEIGIQFALVQSEREDPAFINTAWTMQILRGALIAIAAALLAVPMARFYGQPLLAALIPVICIGAILQGFQSTNYVLLNRRLDERPRALLTIAGSIVTRGTMVMVALLWPTAWALVAGTLTGAVFFTLGTHVLPGPRNRLRWDPGAVRTIVSFGTWILVGSIIAFLGTQLDKLVLGKLVAERFEALGLVGVYVIAQRVAQLAGEATHVFGGQLAFPVLAEVGRKEPHRFEERFQKIRHVMLAPALTLCLGVVVFAPPFFRLLYDDRYAAAQWMAPLITLTVWLSLLNLLVNRALLALGRTRALAVSGGIRVVASLVGGLTGFAVADVPGFIVGLAIGALVQHVTELRFLARGGVHAGVQSLRYTLLFLALATTCAWLGHGHQAEGLTDRHWVIATAAPAAIFVATAVWSVRRVLMAVRSR